MRSSTRRTILWALALVLALVVVGVASMRSGDGGSGDTSPPSPNPRVPEDPGDGCGEAAVTDVSDLSVGRTLARCAPDAPAPQPLDAPGTVRVALTERSEAVAPLLVAQATGAFEDEGLAVEVVDLAGDEAFAAMARGDVDVVVGGIDAPFFDAVGSGLDARLVLGGQVARDPSDLEQPQAGLWMRADLLEEQEDGREWANVEGQTIIVPGGLGSSALYPIDTVLSQHELSGNAVDVRDAAAADAASSLMAAAVGGAWLTEPAATAVAGDDALALVTTTPGSEAIDGTVFSPRLIGPGRAVGAAYVRAVVRTINTHLADGYDDEALAAVAAGLGVDEERVADGPEPLFDWEIRTGTTDRIQDSLVSLGAVRYERPLAERALVDRSLVAEVVGAPSD